LIFPHHENEIAQSEGAFHIPFSRYWIHNGFVNINQEKMSKSLGNFFSIREILDRYDAAAIRQYILASHYRSPIDFSEEGLGEAEKSVERIYDTLDRLNRSFSPDRQEKAESGVLDEFRKEMDDDFNTPRALALIFDEIRSVNRMLDEGKTEGLGPRQAALEAMGGVLGILQDQPAVFLENRRKRGLRKEGLSAESVEDLIRRRDEARREKHWQDADRIRNELAAKGIILEDTPEGTIWKVR
jgi:cysteinyl-tRNA synthetase